MYNKTIISFGFCDILNNKVSVSVITLGIRLSWKHLPRAWLFRILQKPHPIIVYYSSKIFLRIWLAKITRKIRHNQLLSTKLGRILRYVKNDVNRAVKLPDYWTVNREDPSTRFSCFGDNFKMVEHLTRFTRKKRANYWISNRSVSIRTSDVAKMSQRSGKAAESDMKGLI